MSEFDYNIPGPEDSDEPLINNLDNKDELAQQAEEEIQTWLAENGIAEKAYTVTVKKAPVEGGFPSYMPYVEKTKIPSREFLGKEFGPGKYTVGISYWVNDPQTGKNRKTIKNFKIDLDESWQDIHDYHMAEKYVRTESAMKRLVKKARMKNILENAGKEESKSELDSLKESLNILKSLGVPLGQSTAPQLNAKENLSYMTLMMEGNKNMVHMQMENQKNMLTMMMGMMQMMAGNQNKGNSSQAMFKEIKDLVMGTVDLKNALTPEKRTSLDKIIEMIGEMAPGIVSIYQQKGLEAAQNSPLVNAAKGTSQFQDIKNNPVDLDYIIKTMDEKQGPDQTDIFLRTMGLSRPGDGEPEPDIEDFSEDDTEKGE